MNEKRTEHQVKYILNNVKKIYDSHGLFTQFYKLMEEEGEAHAEFFKIEWAAMGQEPPFYIPDNEMGQAMKKELIDQLIVLLGIITTNIDPEKAFEFMDLKTKRQLIRDHVDDLNEDTRDIVLKAIERELNELCL